jgi:hypothetical protein
MVIIPFSLCKNIIWKLDIYEADGYYIKERYDNKIDINTYNMYKKIEHSVPDKYVG